MAVPKPSRRPNDERHANQPYLTNGTRVLNSQDGEPGTIMNGFSFDPVTGWFEFEVETRYGIERWLRADLVLMFELEAATQE